MNQGPQLEQTLQMPNVLAAEGGLAERMHIMGSRVVEWAQNSWETARRYVPRFALAGLAVAGTYDASPADAATVLHHHSSLSTQKVLDRMHNALNSGDGARNKKQIHPLSAHLTASSGGFRNNCSSNEITFRTYKVSPNKYDWDACPLGPNPNYIEPTYSQKGEFKTSLNSQGRQIRQSVGIDVAERTKKITGTRKEVIAYYACTTVGEGVQQIVLDRRTKGSRATITRC